MRHYAADDFIDGVTDTKKDLVEKKISLLQDFCILRKNDDREPLVKTVLEECSSEYEMSRILHDVLVDNITLDAMLTRKGVM